MNKSPMDGDIQPILTPSVNPTKPAIRPPGLPGMTLDGQIDVK